MKAQRRLVIGLLLTGWSLIFAQIAQAAVGSVVGDRFALDTRVQTAVLEESGQNLPQTCQLWPNYPNPFNPATILRCAVPQAGQMDLCLYDVLGRRVRTLVAGQVEPGVYLVQWDGTDAQGRPVTSGVYLGVLRSGGVRRVQRLVLVR